jgi:hypothetical protein
MSVNAPEGYPIEDFSADAVRAQIAEAQKVANGSGSEQDIAEAKIELEVGTYCDFLSIRIFADRNNRFSRLWLPMSNKHMVNKPARSLYITISYQISSTTP